MRFVNRVEIIVVWSMVEIIVVWLMVENFYFVCEFIISLLIYFISVIDIKLELIILRNVIIIYFEVLIF